MWYDRTNISLIFCSTLKYRKHPRISISTIKPSQNPRLHLSHFLGFWYPPMATHSISRSILCRPAKSLSSLFTRSFASSSSAPSPKPRRRRLCSADPVPSSPPCPPLSAADSSPSKVFRRRPRRLLWTIRAPTGQTGHQRRRSCSMVAISSTGSWLWIRLRRSY